MLFNIKTDSVTYRITFGFEKWELTETTKFEPYLVVRVRTNTLGLPILNLLRAITRKMKNF